MVWLSPFSSAPSPPGSPHTPFNPPLAQLPFGAPFGRHSSRLSQNIVGLKQCSGSRPHSPIFFSVGFLGGLFCRLSFEFVPLSWRSAPFSSLTSPFLRGSLLGLLISFFTLRVTRPALGLRPWSPSPSLCRARPSGFALCSVFAYGSLFFFFAYTLRSLAFGKRSPGFSSVFPSPPQRQ